MSFPGWTKHKAAKTEEYYGTGHCKLFAHMGGSRHTASIWKTKDERFYIVQSGSKISWDVFEDGLPWEHGVGRSRPELFGWKLARAKEKVQALYYAEETG